MREIPFDPAILADMVHPEVVDDVDETLALNEAIKDAVDSLPEPDRSVVEAIAWGNMGKTEAARFLGLSRSYVHRIWERAVARVADDLFG